MSTGNSVANEYRRPVSDGCIRCYYRIADFLQIRKLCMNPVNLIETSYAAFHMNANRRVLIFKLARTEIT